MNREVEDFLSQIENDRKREDSRTLVRLMEEESGFKPSLHGKIIGFGLYDYKYDSGREGVAIVTGFSPRKQNIAIYIMPGFSEYGKELEKLGKHKIGKSCLYINKLEDVDEVSLREIVGRSVSAMSEKYECRSA